MPNADRWKRRAPMPAEVWAAAKALRETSAQAAIVKLFEVGDWVLQPCTAARESELWCSHCCTSTVTWTNSSCSFRRSLYAEGDFGSCATTEIIAANFFTPICQMCKSAMAESPSLSIAL